jgi:hypothetical protein
LILPSKVTRKKEGLELQGTHQHLVYADDVSKLDEIMPYKLK